LGKALTWEKKEGHLGKKGEGEVLFLGKNVHQILLPGEKEGESPLKEKKKKKKRENRAPSYRGGEKKIASSPAGGKF